MNDLDFRARAIVDAARDADLPSPDDRDRIKRAVLVQVAAGVAASTVAAGTVSAGAGMSLGMSLGTKVGLAVLAVSLAGGGTVGYWQWTGQHRLASVVKYDPKARSATQPSADWPVEIPAVAASPALVPVQAESKARKPDRVRKLAGQSSGDGERLGAEDRTEDRTEDQLNGEVAVLKRAREELRLGRPAQALEALLEYDRRFGKGVLGEERQAIAAIAACQAYPGASARAQALAFMHSSPASPLLDRVRAACITPSRAASP
jgi:hypothetical protein